MLIDYQWYLFLLLELLSTIGALGFIYARYNR